MIHARARFDFAARFGFKSAPVFRRLAAVTIGLALPALPHAGRAGPSARVQVAPTSGPAPLAVRLDTGGSHVDGKLREYFIFLGNGEVMSLGTTDATPMYRYALPGTYWAQSFVEDDAGGFAVSAPVGIAVARPRDGRTPPAVQMSVAATTDPLTFAFLPTVTATAEDDPIAAVRWDFGDGGTSGEPQPYHTYARPGLYQAALLATTASGLAAYARLLVAATPDGRPAPSLLAAAGPADAAVGTPVTVTAWVEGAGAAKLLAADVAWPAFDDAAPTVTPTAAGYTITSQRSFDDPGAYDLAVTVQLDGVPAPLVAVAHVTAGRPDGSEPPPRVLSAPWGQAREGQPYEPNGPGAASRALLVAGAGPFAFGAAAPSPAGLRVDDAGQLWWTPTRAEVGRQRLAVRIADARGNETVREWVVEVAPKSGCSYGGAAPASPAALWLPALLVGAALVRRVAVRG